MDPYGRPVGARTMPGQSHKRSSPPSIRLSMYRLVPNKQIMNDWLYSDQWTMTFLTHTTFSSPNFHNLHYIIIFLQTHLTNHLDQSVSGSGAGGVSYGAPPPERVRLPCMDCSYNRISRLSSKLYYSWTIEKNLRHDHLRTNQQSLQATISYQYSKTFHGKSC